MRVSTVVVAGLVVVFSLGCADLTPIEADLACDDDPFGNAEVIVTTEDELEQSVRCRIDVVDDEVVLYGSQIDDTFDTTNFAVIESVPDGVCEAIASGAAWDCDTYTPRR